MVLLTQAVKMAPVIDGPFRILHASIEPFLSVQSVRSVFDITIELDKLFVVLWSWSPDADTQQYPWFMYVRSGRMALVALEPSGRWVG